MKTIRNISIAAKIGVAFARVIAVFAVSAGVCIFSVRALDAKQKEIVTSEQTQLPLKGGTADYLNIVWAVLANNLNGKPGHKEWIDKHGDNFNTRLAALRTADGTVAGAQFVEGYQRQYDAYDPESPGHRRPRSDIFTLQTMTTSFWSTVYRHVTGGSSIDVFALHIYQARPTFHRASPRAVHPFAEGGSWCFPEGVSSFGDL